MTGGVGVDGGTRATAETDSNVIVLSTGQVVNKGGLAGWLGWFAAIPVILHCCLSLVGVNDSAGAGVGDGRLMMIIVGL